MEENQSTFESFELQLTSESKEFLKEAGKWAYFLGIIGFIGIGFLVIISFFIGGIFASMDSYGARMPFPPVMLTVLYLAMAVIYFFPVLYLFNFGSKIKRAFADNDIEALTEGIKNLKSHYKFVGIFTLAILGLYALIFIIGIFGAIF